MKKSTAGNIVKKLKTIFSALLKKQAEQEARQQDNYQRANDIQSDDVEANAVKGHHITVLKGSSVCANSTVNSYTFIGCNTIISKTTIGRYNSIANNINIGHGEHPIDLVSTSSFIIATPYDVLTRLDCTITHDVWIGSGATIRRGVTLGIGCIVGANAFVNKNVPPFAVVGGVPARIIKYRFEPEKIDRILASEWWEHDLEEAKLIITQLGLG